MEYVKNAIEKARLDRLKKGSEEELADNQALESVASELSNPEAVNVDYLQTRLLSMSNATLLNNRIVAAFENDERAEPYRQLRTQVLKKFRDNSWRTLAITSAQQGAGKTLTAVNLAITLAKEVNQTVLLADMDFKEPNVLDVLGLETGLGLVDHLKGDVPLQDILINPGLERLTVLPALPIEGYTSEILSSPKMRETLDEIVNRYKDRLIIFDLPPLLRDDDALVFTPFVDSTLLIVENGVTTPEDLERCVQLLEGTDILGTVFNKAS